MTQHSLISAVAIVGLGVFAPLASADRAHSRQPAPVVHKPLRHGHGAPARFFPVRPRHRQQRALPVRVFPSPFWARRPVAMPVRSFAGYLYALSQLYSDAARLDSLRLDARRLYLTAGQVRRILAVMYSDRARLSAVAVLADQIVDPENAYLLDDQFYSEQSRMTARRILASARGFRAAPRAYNADLESADALVYEESPSY